MGEGEGQAETAGWVFNSSVFHVWIPDPQDSITYWKKLENNLLQKKALLRKGAKELS